MGIKGLEDKRGESIVRLGRNLLALRLRAKSFKVVLEYYGQKDHNHSLSRRATVSPQLIFEIQSDQKYVTLRTAEP